MEQLDYAHCIWRLLNTFLTHYENYENKMNSINAVQT